MLLSFPVLRTIKKKTSVESFKERSVHFITLISCALRPSSLFFLQGLFCIRVTYTTLLLLLEKEQIPPLSLLPVEGKKKCLVPKIGKKSFPCLSLSSDPNLCVVLWASFLLVHKAWLLTLPPISGIMAQLVCTTCTVVRDLTKKKTRKRGEIGPLKKKEKKGDPPIIPAFGCLHERIRDWGY